MKELRKAQNKRAYQKKKTKRKYVPSKEDIAEQKRIEDERFGKQVLKYGTTNDTCILFRRIHDARAEHGNEIKSEFIEFYVNHVETCFECSKWAKGNKSDLNAIGNKKYENDELKGYEDFFKTDEEGSSIGGGNGLLGFQDVTEQNDSDILQSLHPLTPEEKERKKSPYNEAVQQQQELGFGYEHEGNPQQQTEENPQQQPKQPQSDSEIERMNQMFNNKKKQNT